MGRHPNDRLTHFPKPKPPSHACAELKRRLAGTAMPKYFTLRISLFIFVISMVMNTRTRTHSHGRLVDPLAAEIVSARGHSPDEQWQPK